jgi:spore germination protein GerM
VAIVGKGKRKGKSAFGWLIFWPVFIIGMILLFLLNMNKIKETLGETKILERLFNKSPAAAEPVPEISGSGISVITDGTQEAPEASGAEGEELNGGPGQIPAPLDGEQPDAGIAAREAEAGAVENADTAGKTISRAIYFIRVDNDGIILPVKVQRTLPQSNSPLRDALNAVIRGPGTEEEQKGYMSFVPSRAKILNATVRGSTAYISFSEDFLFNTYGIEGYAGQLRQVVWTATEFGNVKDVQILIDGKRIDYLGEGIWIGSPVNRTAP